MRRLDLATPWDFGTCPYSGWTRDHWEESFRKLWAPLADSASPGKARQRIPGPRSHHGPLADELEGFSRSFILAAPWLASSGADGFESEGRFLDVAAFYREGLLSGTDPSGPEYWGDPADYAQHLVEMASVAWGLWMCRDRVWNRMTGPERDRVAGYLVRCTRVAYHRNNWLLFNVVTNAVLKSLGREYDPVQISDNLRFCEGMYLGGGWYQDGDVPRIDYYNSWAFHYYFLMWAVLDGDSNREAAERYVLRAREFFGSFLHWMSSDGSTPCFGRSEIYRFAYIGPIALLGMLADSGSGTGQEPSFGSLRTFADLGVKWFLTREILTDTGHLSLGYAGPCADMLEHYSCGGSPYWAAKAFNLLALPKEHPFWTAREAPLPSHGVKPSSRAVPETGLTVSTGSSGHTLLVNHRARHDKAEYNDKYTKLAYASAFPYQARKVFGNDDCDGALQFSADGTAWRQRWRMTALACGDLGGASRYELFETDPDGEISTVSLVLGDRVLHLHSVRTTRRIKLREGGFACGSDLALPKAKYLPPDPVRGLGPGGAAEVRDAPGSGRVSVVRSLGGWDLAVPAEPFQGQRSGCNVQYVFSAVPRLESAAEPGWPGLLATYSAGRVGPDTAEQVANEVCLAGLDPARGELRVEFSDGVRCLLRTPEAASEAGELHGVSVDAGVLAVLVSGREVRILRSRAAEER